jgi:hypothetical protein
MSAAAFTLANSAPSIPLTVVAGVNDSFVFTGDGGLASTPETFTIPAGVYTTLAECVIAMAGAFGSISGMPFAAIVTPSALASSILLSMGSLGAEQNGNTITAAPHDVSANLGFTSPSVFAGGNDAGVFSAPRNGPCSPWITASDVLAQPGCGGAAAEVAAECAAATSELLYALSGQQFTGPCGPVTVRPMARPTDQDTRRAGTLSPLGYMSSWGSTFAYGTVLGAVSAMYGYVQPPMVELVPYPVTEIIEVWIDGVVIPPAEYQLQDFRTLVRMRPIPSFTPTERFGWPNSQIFDLPLTEVGTFGVSFMFGQPPPVGGIRAAKIYAREQCLRAMGQPNQLPTRVTSISRQGVSAVVLDLMDFISQGRTGVADVDQWIKSVNPYFLTRPASVWSPDIGRPQRVSR